MRYWLVMPAAGASLRFGGASRKQYLPLAGHTVIETALRLFVDDTRCQAIALAMSADARADVALLGRLPAKVAPIAGGAQRCDSVLLGLEALAARAAANDWVLVHDAVRPCLSARDLECLLAAGAAHEEGALLAAPVTDTLKQSNAAGASERTVERSALWRALTPQMFRFEPLRAALRAASAAGRAPTDEAQAIEWQGGHPLLVAAQDSNIKITHREDLVLASAVIAARAVEPTREHSQSGERS